jgi:acyl carrier protein
MMASERLGPGLVTSSEIERLLITKTGADPAIFDAAEELPLEELGIDSLAVLELQAVVADEFGLHVPDEALNMTVAEIVMRVNTQSAGV